eukprot:snap_masked-scaffold_15-processed-gene-8.42-mRNA-1 protein AED:1.00 eAED:1.00 QI:0/-1/0/0/-1/1/1/0/245
MTDGNLPGEAVNKYTQSEDYDNLFNKKLTCVWEKILENKTSMLSKFIEKKLDSILQRLELKKNMLQELSEGWKRKFSLLEWKLASNPVLQFHAKTSTVEMEQNKVATNRATVHTQTNILIDISEKLYAKLSAELMKIKKLIKNGNETILAQLSFPEGSNISKSRYKQKAENAPPYYLKSTKKLDRNVQHQRISCEDITRRIKALINSDWSLQRPLTTTHSDTRSSIEKTYKTYSEYKKHRKGFGI